MAKTRKVKEAKDLTTNELIYFTGHAKATYMSDGSTVEDGISKKQDVISDLDTIRSGAAKGATALQSVPDSYATKSFVETKVSELVGSAPETLDTLEELAQALKNDKDVIDVLNDAINGTKNLIEVTYSELKSLRDNSKLTPGSYYRITDYITKITQLNASSAEHQFDLIVKAVNTNTLSEEAKACKHVYTALGGDMTFDSTVLDNFEMLVDTWTVLNDTQIPEDIKKLLPSGIVYDVRVGKFTKSLKQGIIQAEFKHVSGSNKINCIGVDLVQNDKVIVSDYHKGSSGNSNSNNIYTLAVPADGSYVIRYFIEGNSEPITATCNISAKNYISTYFNNTKINSWDIKYCLDNDTSRFNWANNTDGKGVIYYMKDEYENECPYDFKNILFNGYYTFSYIIDNVICDGSVDNRVKKCYGNKIGAYHDQDGIRKLNANVFKNTSSSSYCISNTFENDCNNNTFGDSCVSNAFGNYCSDNSFGNNCQYNTFEDYCQSNTFGSYCQSNTFSVYCKSNTLGSYIIRCTFGKQCINNKFTNGSGSNLEACRMISFGDQCNGVNIYTAEGPSYSSGRWLQNIDIANAMSGSIEVNNINGTRTKYITKTSNGNVIQYFASDIVNKQDELVSGENIKTINGESILGNGDITIDAKNLVEIKYADIKSLCDNNQLVPGRQYRITDYITTANNSLTKSAYHRFDVIVTALTENKLCAEAKACKHNFIEGDNKNISYNEITANNWYQLDSSLIPEDIKNIMSSSITNYDIRILEQEIAINSNKLTTEFRYVRGNNKLNCVGVELILNGVVMHSDYHTGTAGNNHVNNVYNLNVPVSGNYVIRYYIEGNSEPITATCNLLVELKSVADTYFDYCDLDAWQLWYDIDNTANNCWCDNTNGTGVIYRMIDENNNDCPYDFKNIMFYYDKYYYTFSYILDNTVQDYSTYNYCHDNSIKTFLSSGSIEPQLTWNVFLNTSIADYCYSNKLGNNCYYNIFGTGCHSISFGDNCIHNTLGNYYRNIELENNCKFINLNSSSTTSYSNYLQNIKVTNGLQGSYTAALNITAEPNSSRNLVITKDINGNIIRYFNGDVLNKQDKLVSGENIVTVNGNSILTSGNIIAGDISFEYTDIELDDPEYKDYSIEYLTIQSLEDNNEVSFSNSIMYQSEGSNTWSTLNTGEKLVLNTNQEVKFKMDNPTITTSGIGAFTMSKKCNLKGNIMSLLYGDDFIGKTDLTGKSYTFKDLFLNCSTIIDASNLILPATTLANSCYQYMFQGCTGLTVAPELPATTLADYCYIYMFYGCSKLNYIKALFTTTPSSTYTSNWVNGVSSTGTFVKNKDATWNVIGIDGIPEGWTVETV